MKNNERILRAAVGSAISQLEQATRLLSEAWYKLPPEKRWLDDPMHTASNLVYRATKRLKKGRDAPERVEKPGRPVKW